MSSEEDKRPRAKRNRQQQINQLKKALKELKKK